MKLALLLVASAAAWVAPLPRVAHRVARARALRSTADEDASKLADEAAKLRAEIAELEGPSAPAPAPATADAAAEPTLTPEQIAAIEKENAEMEEEIARLTAKPEVPKAAPSGPITDASGAGIKVMIFKETKFNPSHIDNGANFIPPQCQHRNQIGGFYSS